MYKKTLKKQEFLIILVGRDLENQEPTLILLEKL